MSARVSSVRFGALHPMPLLDRLLLAIVRQVARIGPFRALLPKREGFTVMR